MTANAVNDLLTDASGIGVVAVTAAPEESWPTPAMCNTRSSLVIAKATPGYPAFSAKSAT
jgi:hypothetical protein